MRLTYKYIKNNHKIILHKINILTYVYDNSKLKLITKCMLFLYNTACIE